MIHLVRLYTQLHAIGSLLGLEDSDLGRPVSSPLRGVGQVVSLRSFVPVMELTFGARLRAQRERLQVTLAAIAEQSKIRQPLLEALERDDVSQWPGGIFGRSYLRAYAQAIGLSPEATLREFLELHPDPTDDISPVAAAAAVVATGKPARGPRTRLHYLIESAVGALPHALFQPEPKVDTAKPAADAPATASRSVIEAPDPVLAGAADVDQTAPDALEPHAHELSGPPPDLTMSTESVQENRADDDIEPPPVNLTAMAELCTRLARAQAPRDVEAALTDVAEVFHAVGVIVWIWDTKSDVLKPSLAHGYSGEILGRLPLVRRDADNAIAAAFRSGGMRVVDGGGSATGAIVVPLITPDGCAGALALELRAGAERQTPVCALATILAAQLSLLIEAPPLLRSATA